MHVLQPSGKKLETAACGEQRLGMTLEFNGQALFVRSYEFIDRTYALHLCMYFENASSHPADITQLQRTCRHFTNPRQPR